METTSSRYTTRTEAIAREIVEPIEVGPTSADEFDIEAIADEVLGTYEQGYACLVDADDFWAAVARHVK